MINRILIGLLILTLSTACIGNAASTVSGGRIGATYTPTPAGTPGAQGAPADEGEVTPTVEVPAESSNSEVAPANAPRQRPPTRTPAPPPTPKPIEKYVFKDYFNCLGADGIGYGANGVDCDGSFQTEQPPLNAYFTYYAPNRKMGVCNVGEGVIVGINMQNSQVRRHCIRGTPVFNGAEGTITIDGKQVAFSKFMLL